MRKKWMSALVATVGMLALVLGGAFAATTLQTNVVFGVSGAFVNQQDLGADAAYNFSGGSSSSLTDGVAIDEADMVYTASGTIAISGTDDLDVAAGGLLDAFGQTYTIAKMKVLMVCADGANTNNVVVGGDVNSVPFLNTAATTLSLKPNACFQLSDPSLAGIPVTAATGDIIGLANSGAGTSVDYDIIIVGTSS